MQGVLPDVGNTGMELRQSDSGLLRISRYGQPQAFGESVCGPVAPWFSAGRRGIASAATVMLINHRSATRETVAEMSLPVKRNASCIRTHPRWGMRMRWPSRENWSLVRIKRSCTPFLRNFGYFARRTQLDDCHLWRVLSGHHPAVSGSCPSDYRRAVH